MRSSGTTDETRDRSTWTARPAALVVAAVCFSLAIGLFISRGTTPGPSEERPVEAAGVPAPATRASDESGVTDGVVAGDQEVVSTDVVEVQMMDLGYAPLDLTLPAGTHTFRITNTGKVPHEFALSAAGHHGDHFLETGDVLPGETVEVEAQLEPGAFEFACHLPGHYEAGMAGRLDVTG